MDNYIKTNSSILYNKLKKISEISKKNKKKFKCSKCLNVNNPEKLEFEYIYKTSDTKSIEFSDKDLHLLKYHNKISAKLYNKICNEKINLLHDFGLFSTNSIHIIDGVYEEGSNQKYIQENKNIFNSKTNRFSEHFGLLTFDENKISKVTILNANRVDSSDPLIYQPENCIETLKSNYIFHTHPKTPYIGSRLTHGIIYEFPSISDIIHYIDHHNEGKLMGSLIITPEGMYIIHKYYFNREKIKVDVDILIDELSDLYFDVNQDALIYYKPLNLKSMESNGFIKIPEKIFFEKIACNFDFINKINDTLVKYDLYIDFYPRTKLINTDYWVCPDIYLPIL